MDKIKSEIEKLKKKTTNIWAVRKLDLDPTISLRDQANIMIEFEYDKDTNIEVLQRQISGITGVCILKSISSL